MLLIVLALLYRLGFEKSAVRLANLVRYFRDHGKLLETANAYLMSGGTGYPPCAHCHYPLLDDYDVGHEHCWARFRGLPDLSVELLTPRTPIPAYN